jgi:hypothetical protein
LTTRVRSPLLVLVALLAPGALGQAPAPPPQVHVAPILAELRPVRDVGLTSFFVNVSCLADPSSLQGTLDVRVEAPPWANASATPQRFDLAAASCSPSTGLASFNGSITVSVALDAPAHREGSLTLIADVSPSGATGNGSTPIVPGYYGTLNASLGTPQLRLALGETATARFEVTTRSNDDTLVSLRPLASEPGWSLDPGADVLLPPNGAGEATLQVHATRDASPESVDVPVTVRSRDASGGAPGDSTDLTLHVTVVAGRAAGAPAAPVAIALVLAVAGVGRRISRRW